MLWWVVSVVVVGCVCRGGGLCVLWWVVYVVVGCARCGGGLCSLWCVVSVVVWGGVCCGDWVGSRETQTMKKEIK